MEGWDGGSYEPPERDYTPDVEEIDTPEMDGGLISVLAGAMNQAAASNKYFDDVLVRARRLFDGLAELYDASWEIEVQDSGEVYIRQSGCYSSAAIRDGSLHIFDNDSTLLNAAKTYFRDASHAWMNDSGYSDSYVHYTNGVSYSVDEDSFCSISFPLHMVCDHNILEKIVGHYMFAKDRAITAEKIDKPEHYDARITQIKAIKL